MVPVGTLPQNPSAPEFDFHNIWQARKVTTLHWEKESERKDPVELEPHEMRLFYSLFIV